MTIHMTRRPLGLRVRDLREHLGIGYRIAAAQIGVAVGQLHRLENDPTLDPLSSTTAKVEAWLAAHDAPPLAADRLVGHTAVLTIPDLADASLELNPAALLTPPAADELVLYLVQIAEDDWDYDRFASCVAWARSPEDAEQIVRMQLRYPDDQDDPVLAGTLWIESPDWRLEVRPAPTSGVPLVHWHAG